MKKIYAVAIFLLVLITNCKKDDDGYTGANKVFLNGRENIMQMKTLVLGNKKDILLIIGKYKAGPYESIDTDTLQLSVGLHIVGGFYTRVVADGDVICGVSASDSTNQLQDFVEITHIDTKKRTIQGKFEFKLLKDFSCLPDDPDTLRVKCDGFTTTY
jgi:hypothetical protein